MPPLFSLSFARADVERFNNEEDDSGGGSEQGTIEPPYGGAAVEDITQLYYREDHEGESFDEEVYQEQVRLALERKQRIVQAVVGSSSTEGRHSSLASSTEKIADSSLGAESRSPADEASAVPYAAPSATSDSSNMVKAHVRVLAVGDALTVGVSQRNTLPNLVGGASSYRRPLFKLLSAKKRSGESVFVFDRSPAVSSEGTAVPPKRFQHIFEFVGPEREAYPSGPPPNFAEFDTNHAGSWALTAEDALATGFLKRVAVSHQPHILLLQLGTNDLGRRMSAAASAAGVNADGSATSSSSSDAGEIVRSVAAMIVDAAVSLRNEASRAMRNRIVRRLAEDSREAIDGVPPISPVVFVLPILPADPEKHPYARLVDDTNKEIQRRIKASQDDVLSAVDAFDETDGCDRYKRSEKQSKQMAELSKLCVEEQLINASIARLTAQRPNRIQFVPLGFGFDYRRHVLFRNGMLPNPSGEELIANNVFLALSDVWRRHVTATVESNTLRARREAVLAKRRGLGDRFRPSSAQIRRGDQQQRRRRRPDSESASGRAASSNTASSPSPNLPRWVMFLIAIGFSAMLGLVFSTWLRREGPETAGASGRRAQRMVFVRDQTASHPSALATHAAPGGSLRHRVTISAPQRTVSPTPPVQLRSAVASEAMSQQLPGPNMPRRQQPRSRTGSNEKNTNNDDDNEQRRPEDSDSDDTQQRAPQVIRVTRDQQQAMVPPQGGSGGSASAPSARGRKSQSRSLGASSHGSRASDTSVEKRSSAPSRKASGDKR